MLRITIWLALVSGGCGGGGGDRPFVVHDVPGASRALWVFAPDDVWVGGSRVLHFDGATWTEAPPPVEGPIVRFWGLGPDDLWAVVDGARSAVIHWDGASWTVRHELTAAGARMQTVWGSSSSDVWAAGGYSGANLMLHWDGATWTEHELGERRPPIDVWGSAPDDVWAIGETFFEDPGISHWDGTTWTHVPPDVTSHSSFVAGWGSGANDLWLVDGFGTWTHYDGTWTSEPRGVGATDIWGFAADDVWAVHSPAGNSDTGYVIRFEGTDWTDEALPVGTGDVHAIHGSSADNMWVLGLDRVLRLDP
jgi:hypothetical protein